MQRSVVDEIEVKWCRVWRRALRCSRVEWIKVYRPFVFSYTISVLLLIFCLEKLLSLSFVSLCWWFARISHFSTSYLCLPDLFWTHFLLHIMTPSKHCVLPLMTSHLFFFFFLPSIRPLQENKLRRSIHNKLLEIQGNIRVICRVRPVLDMEKKIGEVTDITEITSEVIHVIHSLAV